MRPCRGTRGGTAARDITRSRIVSSTGVLEAEAMLARVRLAAGSPRSDQRSMCLFLPCREQLLRNSYCVRYM